MNYIYLIDVDGIGLLPFALLLLLGNGLGGRARLGGSLSGGLGRHGDGLGGSAVLIAGLLLSTRSYFAGDAVRTG